MSRPARICAYCAKPGKSKEHIFGQWSRGHLDRIYERTWHNIRTKSESVEEIVKKGALNQNVSHKDLTLSNVCAKCNNEWMSVIQTNAAPILLKLSNGLWWDFSAEERIMIASWATMTTMTSETAARELMATTQDERKYLMENGTPPENWHILIGFYQGQKWAERFNTKSFELLDINSSRDAQETPCNTQMTVFTFGRLFLCTYSSRGPFDWPISALAADTDLRIVWPLNDTAITKPRKTISDETADTISQILITSWNLLKATERDA